MHHKNSLNKLRFNYILVGKQLMDLFLNPKSIETVGEKKGATALGKKCCTLFVLKKEMVEFLFY